VDWNACSQYGLQECDDGRYQDWYRYEEMGHGGREFQILGAANDVQTN